MTNADNTLSVHLTVQCRCQIAVPVLISCLVVLPHNAALERFTAIASCSREQQCLRERSEFAALRQLRVLLQLDDGDAGHALVALQHGWSDTSEAPKQHTQRQIAAQGNTALACQLQRCHSARYKGRLAEQSEAHQAWREVPRKAVLQASTACKRTLCGALACRK
jgi:hypothetical protein